MTLPKVSVITVTYNSEKAIGNLVSSLSKSLPSGSEIIIVDNASTDRTIQIAEKQTGVKVIQSEKNLGFSAGCNLGAKQSRNDYLLFLNPDTQVNKNSVEELINYLASHSEVGIVAPKLIEDNGRNQPSARNFPTFWKAFQEYYLGKKSIYDGFSPKGLDPVTIESVVGAAMLIPKHVFQKVGGFSEKYFMYYEDIDLCLKVNKLGLKVVYLPTATFKHQVGGSFSPQKQKWLKDSAKIYHGLWQYWLLTILLKLRPKSK